MKKVLSITILFIALVTLCTSCSKLVQTSEQEVVITKKEESKVLTYMYIYTGKTPIIMPRYTYNYYLFFKVNGVEQHIDSKEAYNLHGEGDFITVYVEEYSNGKIKYKYN